MMPGRVIGRFAWERAVREDPAITRTRQHVLFALATFANNRDGRVTVGEQRLATVTGLSVSAIREHLTGARKAGLLQRITRGHHIASGRVAASTYQLTLPTEPPAAQRLDDDPTASATAVGDDPTARNSEPNRQPRGTQPPAPRRYQGSSQGSYTSGGARDDPPPTAYPHGPEPPRRCGEHLGQEHGRPCGACKDARLGWERWKQDADGWEQAQRPTLAPPCGQCDARPGDPPAARVVWLDDRRCQPCPRCHPRR